ncbi:septum site-determining protein MinC [Deinobacterium chartae]|uniref:Probable septum site-determining protein MinC n=1 Tax=Deinobacterium chartae TaxID=521158 RepID=A0A841HXW5_9DEIO|nr:septum site-determining protein MinC [Deinobacterium chartae]MBB6097736.1 septum site-determining protein MinC [Deinobacterium chartae]
MKLRGTLGGLNLLLEASDTPSSLEKDLSSRAELLRERITLEFEGELPADTLLTAVGLIEGFGGQVGSVRASGVRAVPSAPAAPPLPEGRTEIVTHNLRSGFRAEYAGSVIVLGDVNPGVELIAGGDVIVTGALRGVVHAGAGGNEKSIVWACPIASPQLRIAGAVARAPEGSSLSTMRTRGGEAEIAKLQDGSIVIEAFGAPRL